MPTTTACRDSELLEAVSRHLRRARAARYSMSTAPTSRPRAKADSFAADARPTCARTGSSLQSSDKLSPLLPVSVRRSGRHSLCRARRLAQLLAGGSAGWHEGVRVAQWRVHREHRADRRASTGDGCGAYPGDRTPRTPAFPVWVRGVHRMTGRVHRICSAPHRPSAAQGCRQSLAW